MTRVMFWNIQQFSVNKVDNLSRKRQRGGALMGNAASATRLQLIVDLVREVQPDILVIAEMLGGNGNLGTLVNPNGLDAVITLAGNLGPGWFIVPPLCSGGREGIAILYRSADLIFSGPYRWPGGGGPSAAGGAGVAYAAPLVPPLVGNRPVPGGAHNVAAAENTLAARADGWTPLPVPAGAPAPLPLNLEPRPPYLATFVQINGLGVFQREISIFAVHSPANAAPAVAYMAELARTQEIAGPLRPNEVRLVAGDFNVNLLLNHPDPNAGQINPAYEPLRLAGGGGFQLALRPAAVPAAGFPLAGQGYYATHTKVRTRAQFWPPAAPYPGYGYTSKRFYAIDNFFYRGGAPANFTVVNTIVGSPYTARPQPPGYAPPTGSPLIPIRRRAGLPAPPGLPPPPGLPEPPLNPTVGEMKAFRGWKNYGYIRSTSDHLPIAMDI